MGNVEAAGQRGRVTTKEEGDIVKIGLKTWRIGLNWKDDWGSRTSLALALCMAWASSRAAAMWTGDVPSEAPQLELCEYLVE
jgi:hypothetical protein